MAKRRKHKEKLGKIIIGILGGVIGLIVLFYLIVFITAWI